MPKGPSPLGHPENHVKKDRPLWDTQTAFACKKTENPEDTGARHHHTKKPWTIKTDQKS